MNLGIIAKVLGFLTLGLAAIGIVPLLTAIGAGDARGPWPWLAMIATALSTAALLLVAGRRAEADDLSIREGIAITSLVWIIGSLIGAIGLRLATPQITVVEAWFESMSGFTTTGSTIMGENVLISELGKGVLIWRAIMQWLGGLGIVVISLSLLPLITGGGGFSLYRAEVPGITNERLAPRIADTARQLVLFYSATTLVITLALIASGSSVFSAVCHAMSAISTGGFSPYNDSIDGLQSAAAEWILVVAMLLGGLNFALILAALRGKPLRIWQNTESRVFLYLLLVVSLVVAGVVHYQSTIYDHSIHDLLRHSIFNTVSTATSTGYAVGYHEAPGGAGWAAWPVGAQGLLLMVMVIGGCTGGTGGGSKVIRWVVAWKALRGELRRAVEPNRLTAVTIDGKPLNDRVLLQIGSFLVIMILSWAFGALLMTILGHDFATAMGAAITCLTNNGPGFGEVAVDQNFSSLGSVSQIICIALMLIGRLEFFGIIALCSWRHWRR